MASPPKFTENADAPLSAEELAGDRAASAQTTDPLDAPLGDTEERTHDEADGTAELEEHEDSVVQKSLTMLPPG